MKNMTITTPKTVRSFLALGLASAVLSFSPTLQAEETGSMAKTEVEAQQQAAPEACESFSAMCAGKDLNFSEIYSSESAEPAPTPNQLVPMMAKLAKKVAYIWGDTILEGDYHAAGDTRLDAIEEVYKANELVAYRITYSETAWYLGSCQVPENEDGELDPAGLAECEQGRIVESLFVTPDLKDWTNDRSAYAEFKN